MRFHISLALFGFAVCLATCDLPSLAQSTAAAPPQVQVTFYSSGKLLNSAVPSFKHGKFIGRIMDEYDQLAMLLPGHFITFNLDPGPDTFSANSWMIPRPESGGHLEIDLVPGKHYYIGAYLESLIYLLMFRLEQRTCQEAQQDNRDTMPLEQKHLKKYGATRVLVETSFPACP